MDLDRAKDLIKKSKMFAGNEACRQVAERFEEFLELYQRREDYLGDPVFASKLADTYKQFLAAFQVLAKKVGFSPAQMKEKFENSGHLSPEQWEQVQAIKDRFGVSKETDGNAPKAIKKIRKHKDNRVRI